MERQLFAHLWAELWVLASRHPRGKKQYSDAHIVAVYLWAVLPDRPVCWACQESHWPLDRSWLLQLPSPATMSRRLRTYGVFLVFEQLAGGLRAQFPCGLLKIVDDKPLVVGSASKDKDARRGYAAGSLAKGYRLCVLLDSGGAPDAWRLASLNTAESLAASQLVSDHPGSGYLLADALHDTERFYQAAGHAGWQAIVQPKYPQAQHRLTPEDPWRQRGLQLAANPLACTGQTTSFGQDLLEQRDIIERCFGYWTNFGGGLAPLPNWVRRPHRVAPWIQGKIIIAMTRQLQNHKHLAA
jgi:hypothetical protein